jgi:hypothetical protein
MTDRSRVGKKPQGLAAIMLVMAIGFGVRQFTQKTTHPEQETSHQGSKETSKGNPGFMDRSPTRSSVQRRGTDGGADPAARALAESLRRLYSEGKLEPIFDQLELLAEEKRLAQVSGVLKEWCRNGELGITQWCLVLSEESDQELNLTLAAEALTNPSEVVRGFAAARLEEVSGIRFKYPGEANAWLARSSENRLRRETD